MYFEEILVAKCVFTFFSYKNKTYHWSIPKKPRKRSQKVIWSITVSRISIDEDLDQEYVRWRVVREPMHGHHSFYYPIRWYIDDAILLSASTQHVVTDSKQQTNKQNPEKQGLNRMIAHQVIQKLVQWVCDCMCVVWGGVCGVCVWVYICMCYQWEYMVLQICLTPHTLPDCEHLLLDCLVKSKYRRSRDIGSFESSRIWVALTKLDYV